LKLTGSKKNLASNKAYSERASMIDWNYKKINIKRQAELLKVRRTSLYYKPVGISDEELALMHAIDRIYTKWPAFGYRRITAKLQEEGYQVNRKRVRRLMRKMGISAIYPGPNLSKRNKMHHTYPYLLRNFKIERPNQVWGVDVTYIPMKNGWMYLFAVIDWYSRCIVAWELSNTFDTAFIIRCLMRAFSKAKPEIINSDQGSQFTSNKYIDLLKANNIRISMDGRGRATDNARTERFFRSLKYEKLYLIEYCIVEEVKSAISLFVDEYNNERPHQAIGYRHPADVYLNNECKNFTKKEEFIHTKVS
jgi:putative transposase